MPNPGPFLPQLLFSLVLQDCIWYRIHLLQHKESQDFPFSHHWRTSDLVPYVLLLVQTKVSHLSTLAHFNFRARILSWLKLQTRPQFFICLVLCLLPGVLVSCLLPNSGSLDAMVSQGYLMPGKGGEGDRNIRVMQIRDPPLSRNKDRTEEVQSYNFSPIAHNPAFLPRLSSAGFESCAVFKPQ